MKKTKIICTIGPATESSEMLLKLADKGMNIIRLNFSHGDAAEHQRKIDHLKKIKAEALNNILVMQDLCGPKIRIGEFEVPPINLIVGDEFTLTTRYIFGNQKIVYVNYENLPKEVKTGQHIYLHDGKKKLEVIRIEGEEVICKVLVGGEMKGKRGVNLPESDLSVHALTDKDKKDLEFGVENNVEYFALSFVRKAADVEELRAILEEKNCKAKIISKIETPQAIENIDTIIEASDGIMIARGDLAVEVPYEKVPLYQKEIIEKCNTAGKFVIVATQMLESMVHNSTPTRAEISDVANAVLDGADAVMLSEESSLGHYPIEAVETMARIAIEVENNYPDKWKRRK